MRKVFLVFILSLFFVANISTNIYADKIVDKQILFMEEGIEKFCKNRDVYQKNDLSEYFSEDMLNLADVKIEIAKNHYDLLSIKYNNYNPIFNIKDSKSDEKSGITTYILEVKKEPVYELSEFERKNIDVFNISIKKTDDSYQIIKFSNEPSELILSDVEKSFESKLKENPDFNSWRDDFIKEHTELGKKEVKRREDIIKSQPGYLPEDSEYVKFAEEGIRKYIRNLELKENNDLTKYFSQDIIYLLDVKLAKDKTLLDSNDKKIEEISIRFYLDPEKNNKLHENYADFNLSTSYFLFRGSYKDKNGNIKYKDGSGDSYDFRLKVIKTNDDKLQITDFFENDGFSDFDDIEKSFIKSLNEKEDMKIWKEKELLKLKPNYLINPELLEKVGTYMLLGLLIYIIFRSKNKKTPKIL